MAEFTAAFTLVSQVPIEATFALMAYYQLTSDQLDALNSIIIDGDGTKALFDDGIYKTSYTASQTDAFLALKADKSDTYTISQVNAALALKADTTALIAGLATKQDNLTAGTGIMFIGNTIYATGTAAVYFADVLGNPTDNIALSSALSDKVDKVSGKELSDNNFTDALLTNLNNQSGINTGDETKTTILDKIGTDEFEPKIDYPTENPETKYYRGDGTFQEIVIGSGGYAANLYFTTTDSDVSGYKKISYELPATETELAATFSGTQLLRTYLFDTGIDTTLIDAGLWSTNFSAKLNSSGGVTYLRAEVFLRHIDNTETTLFSATSPELNNTLEYLIIRVESNQPSFACVATDRLGMRVYGITNRANVTITTIIGDGRASYFNTPLKLSHSQLRDFNADTSFLHVTQAEKDAWNAGGGAILPSGTCSTAGATAAKEVSVSGYTETAGACALITFANKNYALGPNLYIPFTGGTAADPMGIYTLTTIGSPTYTGDKFNSNGNTGLLYNITSLGSGAWCIQGSFNFSSIGSRMDIIRADNAGGFGVVIVVNANGTIAQNVSFNGSTNNQNVSTLTLSPNTPYLIKVYFTGSVYKTDVSSDNGSTWTTYCTYTSSSLISAFIRLCFGISVRDGNIYPLIGTMDDLYLMIGSSTTQDYPTLNINGGGAKSILHADGTAVSATNPAYFIANCPIQFCYDGTGYRFKQEVVKTYVNTTENFIIYNNGLVEQSGVTTVTGGNAATSIVTLPITMKNTNYLLLHSALNSGGGTQYMQVSGGQKTSASQIQLANVQIDGGATGTRYVQWCVKGYSA